MEHRRSESARGTAEGPMRRAAEAAQDVAARAGSFVQESAERLSGRAQHLAGDLVQDANRRVAQWTGKPVPSWTRDVRQYIQSRPAKTIALTVAVGYVLGKLLKRR